MRIGLCGMPDEADLVQGYGFDYLEIPIAATLAKGDVSPGSLPIEASNVFFPGDFPLYDRAAREAYVADVFPRARDLGIQVMVVGSGRAREAKEGEDPAAREADFVAAVAELQQLAQHFEIVLAPESLNRTETNVGNNSGRLAHRLREVGVAYTADSYHILREGTEDLAQTFSEAIPFAPAHVHLSGRDRKVPRPDDPELVAFFRRLNEVGYTGRISIEANRTLGEPAFRAAVDTVRQLRAAGGYR
jgi:sugar phosphate isomerase/epimerase